jgi:catalase-peroxidase
VGLIYVNPGGPIGHTGDPIASGEDILRVFGTGMSFDEQETVAIVGGGHAFGKSHGACDSPPCGDGKGINTFTSGFEGAWTTNPNKWDNEFFTNLFDLEWELVTGPGGNIQWKPKTKDGSSEPDIMMLTSDIALSMHPTYMPIARKYADDITELTKDFGAAWYKLVTADMGPSTRCKGEFVPKPQPFQNDLPAQPETLPDYLPVRARIEELLKEDESNAYAFINLAYRCASTFRITDHHGGCNGARIRFEPESKWPENDGTAEALATLELVKNAYGDDVSYTDLISLAAITALERENKSLKLKFCGGGVDGTGAHNGKDLSPRHYRDPAVTVMDDFLVKGLTVEEGVALFSREKVGIHYYKNLIEAGESGDGNFTPYELALLEESELRSIVDNFAKNEAQLSKAFNAAWTKMMTADRFLNNKENACTGVDTNTKKGI